jgi:hypothetical protein
VDVCWFGLLLSVTVGLIDDCLSFPGFWFLTFFFLD